MAFWHFQHFSSRKQYFFFNVAILWGKKSYKFKSEMCKKKIGKEKHWKMTGWHFGVQKSGDPVWPNLNFPLERAPIHENRYFSLPPSINHMRALKRLHVRRMGENLLADLAGHQTKMAFVGDVIASL